MFTKIITQSKFVLVLSVLFVLSVAAPVSLAGNGGPGSSAVVVVDSDANGNVVQVTVQNVSRDNVTVFVTVDAVVGGMNVRGCTPVSVFAGSSAEVVVGFAEAVSDVDSVGIVEQGNPI